MKWLVWWGIGLIVVWAILRFALDITAPTLYLILVLGIGFIAWGLWERHVAARPE